MVKILGAFTLAFSLLAQAQVNEPQIIKKDSSNSIYVASLVRKVFPTLRDATRQGVGFIDTSVIANGPEMNPYNLLLQLPDAQGVDFNLFVIPVMMTEIKSVRVQGTDLVIEGTRSTIVDGADFKQVPVTERVQIKTRTNTVDYLDTLVLK